MLSSRPPPSHPRTRVKLGYGQCPRPAPSRSDTAGSRPRGRPGRRGRQPALPPVFVEGDHEPGLRERVAPVEAQDVDFAEAGLVAGAAQMDAAIGGGAGDPDALDGVPAGDPLWDGFHPDGEDPSLGCLAFVLDELLGPGEVGGRGGAVGSGFRVGISQLVRIGGGCGRRVGLAACVGH